MEQQVGLRSVLHWQEIFSLEAGRDQSLMFQQIQEAWAALVLPFFFNAGNGGSGFGVSAGAGGDGKPVEGLIVPALFFKFTFFNTSMDINGIPIPGGIFFGSGVDAVLSSVSISRGGGGGISSGTKSSGGGGGRSSIGGGGGSSEA